MILAKRIVKMRKQVEAAMQNTQLSPRTQRILKHMEENWEALSLPSRDTLKSILLTGLQEPRSEAVVLKTLAEHMVNAMDLHLLYLLAIFRKNAEQEGISVEDCEETMNDVLPEIMRVMEEVRSRLSLQSLDDLATFINITANLQVLSETDSALDAQNWLYELPVLFHGRLQQERLLEDLPTYAGNYVTYPQSFVYWQTSGGSQFGQHIVREGHKDTVARHLIPDVYIHALPKPAQTPRAIRA